LKREIGQSGSEEAEEKGRSMARQKKEKMGAILGCENLQKLVT